MGIVTYAIDLIGLGADSVKTCLDIVLTYNIPLMNCILLAKLLFLFNKKSNIKRLEMTLGIIPKQISSLCMDIVFGPNLCIILT